MSIYVDGNFSTLVDVFHDEVIALSGITSYSYLITSVLPNIFHIIEVSAATKTGEGAGAIVCVLMDHDHGFVSPPSFVTAETLNSTAIMLSWDYREASFDLFKVDVVGYIIYHNLTSEGKGNVNTLVTPNTENQTYVFPHLMPFTYYEFSVAAFGIYNGVEVEVTCSESTLPSVAQTYEDRKTSEFYMWIDRIDI